MTREVIKEHERKLLIKRLFPTPLAGYEHTLVLFKICRELGDQYCLSFDEKGYTADYKPFNSEEVIDRAIRLLTDDRLLSYVERHKTITSKYHDFTGKYYTYDHKTKRLKLESEWEKIESELQGLFKEHGKGGKAVLRAIWETNVEHDKKWHNYWFIHTLAEKHGLGKGWFKVLSELERIRVVRWRKGDISIPEELIPLIENGLQRLDS